MAVQKKWIGLGVGVFLVLYAFGMLIWLSNQPPILSRSQEKDSLSGYPLRVRFNPIRDRAPEKPGDEMVYAMQEGKCHDQLADWFKDYRRQYAEFICKSEEQHPLVSWTLFDREDDPPLVILHYHVTRRDGSNTYPEDLWVTTMQKDGRWVATKYGALY
ncbi:MAG TPA: hypothetical protein VKR26_05995 [Terriglobales bacterium]|nr:hypothetical protein [Terriglobales bacterium]